MHAHSVRPPYRTSRESPSRTQTPPPLHLDHLPLILVIPKHLVLPLALPVLPVKHGELRQHDQVEEDGEARPGEPRGVGEEVAWFHRGEEDGEDVGDV